MEFKNLTENVKIPVLGLGTGGFGSVFDTLALKNRKSVSIIQEAIKLGVTHIDTAELYANGYCEKLVGEAINEFKREDLFITTKVSPDNLKYNDLINSAKNSLKRLQTKYIDLYLIHNYNPNIPLKETMEAMDFLVEQKLVRLIGVSNFTVEELKEAQKFTKNRITANQIEYNLFYRNKTTNGFLKNQNIEMESKIIPYCQENNIIIIAYRPLAKGELFKKEIPILDELCRKYNKTRAQIALNWLISKDKVVTIPKSSNLEHIKENLGALGWRMEKEDLEKLDKIEFS
ncbi:MAG: aldo/keto reductase [Nanoarchaeota archaeon]